MLQRAIDTDKQLSQNSYIKRKAEASQAAFACVSLESHTCAGPYDIHHVVKSQMDGS